MEYSYQLDGKEISRDLGKMGKISRPTDQFLGALSRQLPFSTDIMPPGVISIRQCGSQLQLVLVAEPGVQLITWSTQEHSTSFYTYELAMPYRVIIGEYHDGQFCGARMFFSPTVIASEGQQLYMCPLPNTNQRGYRNNGVGWVCLYHKDDTRDWTIAQKARRLYERCSGTETYNDANMSSTDGTRFYEAAGRPRYTWHPVVWERKTARDGWEWTLNRDMWIPTLVAGQDDQDRYREDGVPLTLGMAMYGHAAYAYDDPTLPKSGNLYHRDGRFPPGFSGQVLANAFAATEQTATKPQPADPGPAGASTAGATSVKAKVKK